MGGSQNPDALAKKTLLLSSRALLVPVALAFAASLSAQCAAQPPALGLLRLKSATRANDAAPLAAGKFSVDELSAAGVAGASKAKKNNVDYIALDSGKEWARPLRGNPHDVTFVSFQVYASQTTIIVSVQFSRWPIHRNMLINNSVH